MQRYRKAIGTFNIISNKDNVAKLAQKLLGIQHKLYTINSDVARENKNLNPVHYFYDWSKKNMKVAIWWSSDSFNQEKWIK